MLILTIASLRINKMRQTHKHLLFLPHSRQSDSNEVPSELTSRKIFDILDSKGLKPSMSGHWIVFVSQEDEYAINTSGYPVLSLLKQTSLDGYDNDPDLHEAVAMRITGEIMMTKIHIKNSPSHRVIFQLNAVEDNSFNFEKRLEIYLDIIKEAEERFFSEVKIKK